MANKKDLIKTILVLLSEVAVDEFWSYKTEDDE